MNPKEKNNVRNNAESVKRNHRESVMIKPEEVIPIMAQSSDPLGSYTGTPAEPGEKPVQDADDL